VQVVGPQFQSKTIARNKNEKKNGKSIVQKRRIVFVYSHIGSHKILINLHLKFTPITVVLEMVPFTSNALVDPRGY